MKIGQPQGLISVLLDAGAPFGDRSDAAMDLGGDDDPAAENALLLAALDLAGDPDLADDVGDSLRSIWLRKGCGGPHLIASFHPEARKFLLAETPDNSFEPDPFRESA